MSQSKLLNSKTINLPLSLGSSSQNSGVNVARNESFPIHADFTDQDADFDKYKPGGIFTKHLYTKDVKIDINSNEMPKRPVNPQKSLDFETAKHGGSDAKYSGFYNTEEKHRIHYKLARLHDSEQHIPPSSMAKNEKDRYGSEIPS